MLLETFLMFSMLDSIFFNAMLFESKLWGMIIYDELENKDILEMR